MSGIVSITGSGCWSAHGADWNATRRCATRWRGPTICSTTPKSLCWQGVRYSLADSTFKAPARLPDSMTPTTTPSSICSTHWCASRFSSSTGQSGGRDTRCWRRSASSPKNNSSPPATAEQVRTAHARYFAEREADILALWDSPRQREAYTWFTAELANLRTAFRWAADHGDLDVAATIATYAGDPRLVGRQVRADCLGRRADRARPRRRPSPARSFVRDGVAVLYFRTARGRCRLQRRLPDGYRQ